MTRNPSADPTRWMPKVVKDHYNEHIAAGYPPGKALHSAHVFYRDLLIRRDSVARDRDDARSDSG